MRISIISLSGILILACFSCSSIENIEGKDKAETYFLRGSAYLEEDMYDEALEKFKIVKNKFPYSVYALESELKIADTYFKKGDYIHAQKLYILFSELHPQEHRRDYAIFRSGMSFYNLLPSSIDRDLSLANRAIGEFKSLIELYPGSVYFKEALNKYTETRIKLARKEIYVGDFYKKRGRYAAAVERYKKVLSAYADLGFEEELYFKIANCFLKLGSSAEARYYGDLILLKFPEGDYSGFAKKLQKGE